MCVFSFSSAVKTGLPVTQPRKKPSAQRAQTPVSQETLRQGVLLSHLPVLWLVHKDTDVYFFFFLLVVDLLGTTVSSFGGLGVKFEEGASTGSLITVMSTS